MTRQTHQWKPGQRVIRTHGRYASRESRVVTIDSVTPGGRAKIGDEVFLPDGRRLGDASDRRDSRWGSATTDIRPATDKDVAEVERAAQVRDLRWACVSEITELDKQSRRSFTNDPGRLTEALAALKRAREVLTPKDS